MSTRLGFHVPTVPVLHPLVAAIGIGVLIGLYAHGISISERRVAAVLAVLGLAPFVVAIVGDFRRLLLALVLFDVPLQLDVHFGYRADVATYGAIVGWNVSLTTIGLLGLYSQWVLRALSGVGRAHAPNLRASLPLALYLGTVVLSLLSAYDVMLTAFEIFLLGQVFLLYLYIVSTVRTRDDLIIVVTLLLVGVMMEGVLMVVLRVLGEGFMLPTALVPAASAPLQPGQPVRAGGTLSGPNQAATYFSILLPLALATLLTPLPWRYKVVGAGAFCCGGVGLLLTLTRGGWMAFALALAIFCVLMIRRGWLSPLVPMIAVTAVAILAFLFQDLVLARIVGDDQGSAFSRVPLIDLALSIIGDHMLLGVGANNFAIAMQDYITLNFSIYGGDWLYIVHTKYLLVLAETGIIGLVAFLTFLLTTLYTGWRGWQLGDRLRSPLALSLVAAIAGHMVHLTVDIFNARPQVQTLWLAAGLLVAIVHSKADGEDPNVGSQVDQPELAGARRK